MRRALVTAAAAIFLTAAFALAACAYGKPPTLTPAASPTAARGRTIVTLFELHNAALRFATKDTAENCGDQAAFHIYGFKPGEEWNALITTMKPQEVPGFKGATSGGHADKQGQVVFMLDCTTYTVGTYAAQVYNSNDPPQLMALIRFMSQ